MSLVPGFAMGSADKSPQKSSNMLAGLRTAVLLNDVDEVLRKAEFLNRIGGIEVVRVLNSILCEVGVQNEASYALRAWITSLQRDPMPEMPLQVPAPATLAVPTPQRPPSPRLQQTHAQLEALKEQNSCLEAELNAMSERWSELERELGSLARISPAELQELRDHIQLTHQQMGQLRTLHIQQLIQSNDDHARELEALRFEHARQLEECKIQLRAHAITHDSETQTDPILAPAPAVPAPAEEAPVVAQYQVDPFLARLQIRPVQIRTTDMFFAMLNHLLAQAERTRNIDPLRDLVRSLIQSDRDLFKACVRRIRGLSEGSIIPEDNLTNAIWYRIFATHPLADRQVITNYIANIRINQPEYLHGIESLMALLDRWEHGLATPQAENVLHVWETCQPILKLYYLEFIRFYFAAQNLIVRYTQQRTEPVQHVTLAQPDRVPAPAAPVQATAAAIPVENLQPQEMLHRAILADSAEDIHHAVEAGANVNQEREGKSPLLNAVMLKRSNAIEVLLETGANTNVVYHGHTLVLYATKLGNLKSAILLVKRGAVFAGVDNLKKDVIDYALNFLLTPTNEVPRVIALELMLELFNHGYNPHLKENCLMHFWSKAIQYEETLEFILRKGANPNQIIYDYVGGTFLPMFFAICANNKYAVKLLLGAGADVNLKTHFWPKGGGSRTHGTLLNQAIELGYMEIVDLLLQHGASL